MANGIKKHTRKSVERISQTVLYCIVAVIALVFLSFYLVGYDTPYGADSGFYAPALTDGILILMYLLVLVTLGVMGYSVVKSLRSAKRGEKYVNGIPVQKISYSVSIGTAVVLVLTFLLGSTKEMLINGVIFSDKLWLRLTDMFLNTIIVLLLVSVGAVLFGATRYRRGKRVKK